MGIVSELLLTHTSLQATGKYTDINCNAKQSDLCAQKGNLSMWRGTRKEGKIPSMEKECLTMEASTEKMAFELHLNQMRTSPEGGWRKACSMEEETRMCLVDREETIVTAL